MKFIIEREEKKIFLYCKPEKKLSFLSYSTYHWFTPFIVQILFHRVETSVESTLVKKSISLDDKTGNQMAKSKK